jgi:hypothetical protein
MIRIIDLTLLAFLFFTLTSCDTKNNKDSKKTEEEKIIGPPAPCAERSRPLDVVNNTDTLKIIAEISDCGEWGGHRESIYLQRNRNREIIARFIMDTISCDKIIEKGGLGVLDDKARAIVLDTTKILKLEDEKLLSLFLQRLLELYLKAEMHSNGGNIFRVINTDSELNFTYWNSGNCRDTYYEKVREQLFGDILKLRK